MADYRLYILDAQGRITRAIELQRETDAEAVREASSLDHLHGMELWQLKRHVRTFNTPKRDGDALS